MGVSRPLAPPVVDPLPLAKTLIAIPSVTPAGIDIMEALAETLRPLGFRTDIFESGGPPDERVANLFATRGSGGPHFAFAGHLDVVPPGGGWATDPFEPAVRGELLHGRGAVDMKGAIAAFVAAVESVGATPGTLSLIITGDEEGHALHGTVALIEHMERLGARPDLCLVGEPTSALRLGDVMKIGRRGSVNMWIEVPGTQGHVAYPHLADNPITRLVRIMTRIDALMLDEGNDWFQPSNIEFTDVDVGNPATNVIPAAARARLSIRFNDGHRGDDLAAMIRAIVEEEAPGGTVLARISGEAFLTPPGALSDLVSEAVREVTGLSPELSTTGGTSDARFLSRLCPVVEFGLLNATMHKLDEAVAIADLWALRDIYVGVLRRVFLTA